MPRLSADTTFGMALHGTGLPLLLLLSVAEFRATTAVAGRLELNRAKARVGHIAGAVSRLQHRPKRVCIRRYGAGQGFLC